MGYKTKSTNNKPAEEKSDKENRNEVYLSGKVFGVWMNENSGFALIDVGMKQHVPCSLYGDDDKLLADKLDRFREGDPIQIVGYVRPWSTKVDGEWVRKMDIRITDIKGPIPAQRETSSNRPSWASDSDSIPF